MTRVGLSCSVWTFLLVGLETAHNRKTHPHLALGPYRVPTWALLLLVIICTEALIPNTSLIGHMCGAAVGYICKPATTPGPPIESMTSADCVG